MNICCIVYLWGLDFNETGNCPFQREDLHKIMDMLSLKEHHARTLLIHYRWDVEKILAVLVERGTDQLYVEAGVRVTEHANVCSTSSSLTCDVCIEEKPANKFTTMDCGHYFCNDCKYFCLMKLWNLYTQV